ncbi:MAG: toxin-activating lysine-acyltransferase [Pseudomonadota bacterium]
MTTSDDQSAAAPMQCRQFKDPVMALGRATNLLMRTDPFASFEFGRFSKVLQGQIRRRHYVFTLAEGVPVGYAGWALCNEDIARAWIEERSVPTFEQCRSGDTWVGITFYAASREVCFFQSRFLRRRYPGMKVMTIRDYGARRRSTSFVNSQPLLAATA